MSESADELRNLILALLANAKALKAAGKAAREQGLLLMDMARTTKDAAASSRKQGDGAPSYAVARGIAEGRNLRVGQKSLPRSECIRSYG